METRHGGEQALGLIETIGMTPALKGADSMLKAADVRLAAYENIGSTLVAVMVSGDVAAVRAAVEAGAAAASAVGRLTARNVMPRPGRPLQGIVAAHAVDSQTPPRVGLPAALGLVETFGIVFILEAADAMTKAADVDLIGYENVASGYISVLVQGDVAACAAAVKAGTGAVERMGAEVYSSTVIAGPHPDLLRLTARYNLENPCSKL